MTEDPLVTALARVDPTRVDHPPATGSARYDSILERSMRPNTLHGASRSGPIPKTGPEPRTPDRPAFRRRRTAALALGAAVVTAVVGASLALLSTNHTVSPAAAVTSAAATTGEVTSLRGALTEVTPDGETTSTIEVAGNDMRVESRGTYSDGRVDGSTTVIVGDELWQVTLDGDVETATLSDESWPAPFAVSSAAVVTAALAGGDVVELGEDHVRGISATHYRIDLDGAALDAMAALSPGELAWFELEHPEDVTNIHIWVADDLIRRIQIITDQHGDPAAPHGDPASPEDEAAASNVAIDFYDFNADINIAPPRS